MMVEISKANEGNSLTGLKTSNNFKKSIYILYLESIVYFVDHSLHAVFITNAGIWCSL